RRGVERIRQPAVHLVSQDDRGNEVARTGPLRLADREARRDLVARMNGNPPDIGIVEIEVTQRRTIGEGGKLGRGAAPGANDGGVAGYGKREIAADTDRAFVERPDRAPDRVDDMHLDALDGAGVEVLMAQI